MKQTPLRLLLVEDSNDDAVLIEAALERSGFAVDSTRVLAAADFRAAVEDGKFDIVLCDHALPSFDAGAALGILRESGRDLPLIVVSGAISEQVAVEAMRAGAVDYLLKNNLARLGPAVAREIREAEIRRQKRLLDSFAQGQTDVLAMILNGKPLNSILDGIASRVEALTTQPVRCSIMLVNPEGTQLVLASAPGLPPEYRNEIRVVPIRESVGSCGSAAALGKNVVVEDIWTHPDWSPVRELTRKYGLRACWAVPVFSAGRKVLGTLSVYHRTPHLPSGEELRWVETASNLVTLAIERSEDAARFRSNEALLRIASDAAQIGGWIADFVAERVSWSDQVCAIHEVPPGTTPDFDETLEFYAPEWREKIAAAFEKCLFEGVPFDEEMQVITSTGRWIWVRTIGVGIRGEDGSVTRIQGALQDITGKKEAAAEAARLAARLTTTVESITDAFFTVDRDWRFTYVNGQAEKILGREAAELLGKVFWEEFPDFSNTRFGEEYRRAIERNQSIEMVEFYPPRGRWYEVRAYPSVEGLAVYTHDVTAQRQAQEQLKFLENCVSRINDIVLITGSGIADDDETQRIVFVNDAFIHHMGYGREEVLDREPHFLSGPRSQLGRLAEMREALDGGEPGRAELIAYTKGGVEIWLEVEIVPVADGGGKRTHMVAVAREITRRKLAEEVARAAEARYLLQRNALIKLTRDTSADGSDLTGAFRRITETAAETMGVAGAGIWRCNREGGAAECHDFYRPAEGTHGSGEGARAPAGQSASEPFFRDFPDLDPPLSIMDVPVQYAGAAGYFLCIERAGPPREWTADEKTFAVAVANLVSLALESGERARAEREVLRSHQRFQSVAAATNDTIWDWDLETNSFWWNDGFARLFGWSAIEVDASIQAWIRQIHPEDRNRVVQGIYAAIERGDSLWVDEYRFISNDGGVSDVIDRGQVIRDADGKALRMVGGMTDLTAQKAAGRELARSHRALQMLTSCSEMLVRTPGENELLAEACRIAVEVGGYRMAWVGYALETDLRPIVPMAFAGEEQGYLSEVDISWGDDHSSGIGPAGQAVRSGEPVVFEDVVGNPAFSYWLAPARKRGYRSVVCLPLRDRRRTFGVLCLYTAEPNPATPEEIKLLGEMADDLVFGIENCRGRLERQRTTEVVIKVAQAISSGTGSEFFDLLSRNMVESTGALGGFVGRYLPADEAVETMSFFVRGKRLEDIRYELAGTPSRTVLEGEIRVFERGVQQLFPEDRFLAEMDVAAYAGIPLRHQGGSVAGIMAVFFSQPLEDSSLVRSTLQIFAARAAAELDRQQADARIREQASLLDKARDAIVVRDLDHRVTFWNKSAERLYGWSAAEVMGRPVVDFIHRDDPTFEKAQRQTLRTGEWAGEMTQLDKHGRELIIEGRWTLVRGEKGEPESVLVINTDISEHRRLEQQFHQAQRMESIGTLAGGIAHDLNNILAPISMAIELLRMRATDDRSTELLETIASSAKRGADMVGQVLSFARGVEGRRVEVEPRALIAEIEGILRDTLMKNISMEVQASPDLWIIHGDPTQLHQVLLNLCVNAADAVACGGRIFIAAGNIHIDPTFAAMNLEAKEGDYVCIEVRDTGEGIPPEILGKIFDPFFTTKSVGKGTGLGLSTSLAIVKGHGGFIRVTSEPGKGSRFKIYLPADPERESPAAHLPDLELPAGNGETVLIVDDEESIRLVTRDTLEAFGYRTLLAGNGHEAVSIYGENQDGIDVVLTDMMMPVMDGPAAIRLLMEINPAVRIIASSGISGKRDAAMQSGAGVRNFLPKPYTADTLLKCLKQTLEESD